ncbi:hypothetical protein CTZ27_37705 [Streptomyces griseocarneus]|nr:hypothetical protein CTZ27_37705 [Streptomyces griseocarneus]
MHDISIRRLGTWAGSMALLATAAVTGPGAAPAHAATGDLKCTVHFTMSFNPALQPGGSAVATLAGALATCSSPNGSYPALHSGTGQGTGQAKATGGPGPCAVVFTASGTGTVIWNTKQQSTLSFTVTTDPTTGQVGFNCTVTSGPMTGDKDTVVITGVTAACTTDGGTQSIGADMTMSLS